MTLKTVSMIAILTAALSSPVFARHQHHARWLTYQKPQQRVVEYPRSLPNGSCISLWYMVGYQSPMDCPD
jgi:hypothetical protein